MVFLLFGDRKYLSDLFSSWCEIASWNFKEIRQCVCIRRGDGRRMMLMEQTMAISSLSLSYNLRNPANTHLASEALDARERIYKVEFLPLWEPSWDFPFGSVVKKKKKKNSACQYRKHGLDPWVGKIPWGGKWQLTLVFMPGKSHGQRSLVGSSPWGCKELDTKLRD